MENKTEGKNEINTNEAMALIKSMQGAREVIVPISLNGTLVHKGMKFTVSISDYNTFINSGQNAKISPTIAAKDLLMHTVAKEDKEMLTELLKIAGTLDNITMEVVNQVAPDMSAVLD
ncbi:putative phage tail assembly chaperone [Aliivibrio sp. S2TY2]|uniref:putative phage tail assembly chaperone n=1 Tax=unclassified Aliivibrio TaxID=2645654 RepID=UPI002378B973|nr:MULTISPECIES: putative phage tail assembly chaperone [unclassified Aliivibrio]MDD9174500.1 putative phage tail assembly chaperone [Aliivibrio sp. S3TY1]MDD9191578.1 putative phage tail assembly chaperone [Aliivibrio sp. S2TY2]